MEQQPDPIPLSALLGRLGVGQPQGQLDPESHEMRENVLKRYNMIRDLIDALEHISGVPDWDLQMSVVDALKSQVEQFQAEFHLYANKRKEADAAKQGQNPV